jgi:hypothetical protein
MSKVMRGTLVGLAVAAIAAPLAQAESKAPRDVSRAGDVSRRTDVGRMSPWASRSVFRIGEKKAPKRLGDVSRMNPLASSDRLGY